MFDLSKFSRTPLSENFCECCKPSEKTSFFTNKNMFSMKEFDRERDRSNKKEVFIFENYTEKKNYKKFGYFNLFEFNIKEEEIRFVDGNNEEIFNEALSFISFQKILSIDTEHYKEPTNKLKTGTIQISTSKYIYIFDILMIVNCQKWEIFIEKLDSVMKAENILKIFYEPIQDLKILNYTVNYKYFRKFNRVIDLSEVKHEFLEKIYHIKIKGLKGLCENIFGKSLNKNEQTSNWEKRPLCKKQILYAGLDAFILIKIYNYFMKINHRKVSEMIRNFELMLIHPNTRTTIVKTNFHTSVSNSILIE